MAKAAKVIDQEKFTKAVQMAEQTGPLKSFTALYDRVVELYNSMNPPAPINSAYASAKIDEWDIPVKTTAARKGAHLLKDPNAPRPEKVEKETKEEDDSHSGPVVICGLTDWEDKLNTRGFLIGQTSRFRYVLVLEKRNWVIARQAKAENVTIHPEKFMHCFSHLLSRLSAIDVLGEMGVCETMVVNVIVPRIANRLAEISGIPSPLKSDYTTLPLYKIGNVLDQTYKVNFLQHKDKEGIKTDMASIYERFSNVPAEVKA